MTEKATRLEQALNRLLLLGMRKQRLIDELVSQRAERDQKYQQLTLLRGRIERRDDEHFALSRPAIMRPASQKQREEH